MNYLDITPTGIYLKGRFDWVTSDATSNTALAEMVHEAADEARALRRRLGKAIAAQRQELTYIADSLETDGKLTRVWSPTGSSIHLDDLPKRLAQDLDVAEQRVAALIKRVAQIESSRGA